MPLPKDRFWFRRVTRNNRYSMHTLKSERKLPCRVSPTAVVFKSAPSVIPGDCENDASIVFPLAISRAKTARWMNKSVQNDRERGKCRLETTTFSRIRIERDSSNIDRSIDRSFGENAGNISI